MLDAVAFITVTSAAHGTAASLVRCGLPGVGHKRTGVSSAGEAAVHRLRRNSQLGGLTNRPDAEAQQWPSPDFERQARIVSVCNQLPAQGQHRRSPAHG
jgi:hypothetical protein